MIFLIHQTFPQNFNISPIALLTIRFVYLGLYAKSRIHNLAQYNRVGPDEQNQMLKGISGLF